MGDMCGFCFCNILVLMHFYLGKITCRDVVTLDTSISFFSSRPWTREKIVVMIRSEWMVVRSEDGNDGIGKGCLSELRIEEE